MKVIIEDYDGNPICSFYIHVGEADVDLSKDMVNCSYADKDTDEEGEYIIIQLEEE